MNIRIRKIADSIRSSYWFVPASMSLMAFGLSILMLILDRRSEDLGAADTWWLYGGGAEGSRVVLSTIVTAMISVTSVVFSITIVALTLAAGQFGSRVLRNFMRDRGNQITLGTFIATFVYAMLVLRSLRGGDDSAFVPPLAMSVGILLVFLSVGVLIYFIHHIANSIQADTVVRSIFLETEDALDRLFPASVGGGPSDVAGSKAARPDRTSLAARLDADGTVVRATRGDYLQMIDDDRLMELAVDHGLLIRLHAKPGDFVVRGGVIACVWKDGGADSACLDTLRDTFAFGPSRSLEQDAEFGILELVEVAVRALSSGVNDPFTAMNCVDRISSLLCRLATRTFPSAERLDDDGRLRVVIEPPTFAGFLDAGFNQIRQNAGHSVAVLVRMFAALERIGREACNAEQRQALAQHAARVLQAGLAHDPPASDREQLERAHTSALKIVLAPQQPGGC